MAYISEVDLRNLREQVEVLKAQVAMLKSELGEAWKACEREKERCAKAEAALVIFTHANMPDEPYFAKYRVDMDQLKAQLAEAKESSIKWHKSWQDAQEQLSHANDAGF